MVFFTHRNLLLSLWITTGLSVCLAIYGGIAAYSPVPFWDMWDHLDLAAKAPTGGLQVWWEQHNEHRIVLAKVLFLVDQSYFHGNQWFLILANYLIVALSCVVFVVLLKEQLGEDADPIPLRVLSLILVTMLVSWIQIDNLTWAFQSQFFLAQLLPLIALFLLFKSAAAPAHSRGLFILACGVGFISIGTMANGVLALPLMLGLSLILRVTRMRLAILALVAIAGVSLYFFDYHGVSTHGNPGDAGRNAPGDIIRYVLLYLGGPFYFFTFGSKAAAYTAGAFLVCSSVVFALQCMRSPRVGGGQIVTLAFLAYLGATALVTAAGRLSFGVDQALAGRYQTPALMAWAALLILYAPSFSRLLQRQPVQGISLALMIALLLLPQQLTAIKNKQDYS
ncbi:hypothetical protein [uncultured Thiodictyon sp.]|uniref:hypothetical protein n=1 Tax=uncultured Thiodictyon sp. TaxID=1846217 RepID=UPI0025ED9D0D|nr:hypothetical protein [uncultured Thiodictyon sp.]